MKLSRTLRYGALLALLAVAVVACGSDSKGSSGSSTTTAPPAGAPLEETRWNLQDTGSLPLNGVAVTATFADGSVDGSSGCNQYGATYETKGKSGLVIGPQIMSTQVGCEPGPTAVEHEYLQRLPETKSYVISGKTLTLRDSAGASLLVYKASDGATEIIGKWTVTTLYTGDAVQSVANGSLLTADFKTQQVVGNGGCNAISGPYVVTGSAIKVGPFASSLRACPNSALQTQEQQFMNAMELATNFRITGNTLSLTRADGGVAVTFVRG
jgi:heat shock protein HslJ